MFGCRLLETMFPVWETGKHWGNLREPRMFLKNCFLVLLTVYWNWPDWVQVKRPSQGKLKLAKSCWLTQVDVCERHKNSRQTRFSVFDANSLQTCLPPVFVPFTHTNLGLPTRVCQVKFAVWRPLKKASDSVQRPPTDCRETNWSNFAANGILNQINALLASSQMLEKTINSIPLKIYVNRDQA